MSNPSGPDQPDEATQQAAQAAHDTEDTQPAEPVTDPAHEPATEILLSPAAEAQLPAGERQQEPERRFTAPSNFDAGATQKIEPQADPATEVMPPVPKNVAPQLIPGRGESPKPQRSRRSWGWVVALILVIAALVAVAILGTVLLTRNSTPKASEADKVRTTRAGYVSFDQVVVSGQHAEVNVTTFVANAPETRSTRSFDLQLRDDQWKICQAPDA